MEAFPPPPGAFALPPALNLTELFAQQASAQRKAPPARKGADEGQSAGGACWRRQGARSAHGPLWQSPSHEPPHASRRVEWPPPPPCTRPLQSALAPLLLPSAFDACTPCPCLDAGAPWTDDEHKGFLAGLKLYGRVSAPSGRGGAAVGQPQAKQPPFGAHWREGAQRRG